MPLRLNIGLSKKVGLPDYGSLGASANLELELDSGAVSDPDRLRQQVRYLFGLAKQSVEEELNQQQAALPHTPTNGHNPAASTNGNGRHHANSNGHRPSGRSNGRAATASQVRAIKTIASRQRLNLTAQLEPFGVQAVEDLSIQQASRLIDELKAEPVGAGGSQ
jgi:hypothetical protein